MKTYIKVTLFILAAFVSFTACRESEEEIIPSGNYSPIRGGFPQGNTEYDSIINEIKNKYSVYLLYKDVTEEDMNRTWVSAGTGDIYVAGDTALRKEGTWTLPMEQLPIYVDFFNDYIFPNIDKELAQKTFPVKIYMINNLRTEPRDYGEENKVVSGTDTNPNKIIKLGEFDNWAISIPDSIIEGKNSEYTLKQMRCVFMINIIKNSIAKGDLVAPDEFWEDYSMNRNSTCLTSTTTKNHEGCDMVNVKDKEAANGLYTLGYVDVMEEKFGTENSDSIWKKTDIFGDKDVHADTWNLVSMPTWNLFEAYIMNAMWLTTDEFNTKYNTAKHTKIKEKYDLVVEYMKEFGIDLVGIAEGKKEEEGKEELQ
ncbi:MAG: hypothetical protein J6V20_01335 [Bacteroidaceae bacterium]|nr:hypothetical protein [Bacteroidaceae bacterium]